MTVNGECRDPRFPDDDKCLLKNCKTLRAISYLTLLREFLVSDSIGLASRLINYPGIL
jgi:hypothetical protein